MEPRYPIKVSAAELLELSDYVANANRQFEGLVNASIEKPPICPSPNSAPASDREWDEWMHTLRRYRAGQSIHALWLDLTGEIDIHEMGQRLSQTAHDLLALALHASEQHVAHQYGSLMGIDGEPLGLSVLGLGKLGGNELNFNSDIDVVLAYRCNGKATGPRQLEAPQYLAQVARGLIQQLDAVTPQGRCWVVDTRLRPFGASGALVWSLPAMEAYFLGEGRAWERYAWLKASHAAGDEATCHALLAALRPFIYRRYLDYGIFESLRALHKKIDGQSQLKGQGLDIKRGPGGIRALEFLVQSLQLLEGGRNPSLQVAGFRPALEALTESGHIHPKTSEAMREAYGFLRTLENRLQAMTGRQTHELPKSPAEMERLARLMGFDQPKTLIDALDHHRHWVRDEFSDRFSEREETPATSPFVWPPSDDLVNQIAHRGVPESAQAIAEELQGLEKRLARRPLSAEGRARLERLMPRLIEVLIQAPDPMEGLADVMDLIEQIAQRSAYLALLYEKPEICERVVSAFRASEQIAKWVIRSPQLLDDLIDPAHQNTMPAHPDIDPNDPELGLNALGRWRQACFLRVALAEVSRQITPDQASLALTQVAETCIQVILQSLETDTPLAVIAYGNCGARTMHYGSDLDCVFLHDAHSTSGEMARIAQRLISFMQLPLPGGRLFEIDTRLRPNGRAGSLVSEIDQFGRYQQDSAWLWEHQALIRARWVAGDPKLEAPFEAIRQETLRRQRDKASTAQTLKEMRQKQLNERAETPIKQRLTDLQFAIEFGVLTQAHDAPELATCRSPEQQIETLSGLEPPHRSELLKAWRSLIEQQHHQWLDRNPRPTDAGELEQVDGLVARTWQALMR